ncbi:hypothetical protein [Pseudomonas sp. 2835]|uniref:hypothetical protein n=1 Tax=Pseudomonas sp. 2835 TaxID=3156451 RepID=UPI003D18FEDF
MRRLIVAAFTSLDGVIQAPGKRLFDDQAQAASFTLAESNSTPGGVLIARYVLDGEVRTGSFA